LKKKVGVVLLFLVLGVFFLGGLVACNKQEAQDVYPCKPVNMIIAFTAGGSSDVQARIVEKFEYHTGAGGQVGFTEITKATPDGYTIGGINVPHIVFQSMSSSATFALDDFAYLAQVVKDPLLLAVNRESKINTLEDFIQEAKLKEGKLNIGIVGPFTAHHIGVLQLADLLGIELNPVIFKGAADQNVALLGGHVEAMLGNLNDVMRDLSGFKILALAAEERHPWIQEVPTFRELNVDFEADIRRGFAAPRGIEPAVLEILRSGLEKICHNPEYLQEMEKIGQPENYLSGEEFEQYVMEYAKTARATIQKYNLE
jgi:tripartite-type tricarboxylate transporter receptor subunit TctC